MAGRVPLAEAYLACGKTIADIVSVQNVILVVSVFMSLLRLGTEKMSLRRCK